MNSIIELRKEHMRIEQILVRLEEFLDGEKLDVEKIRKTFSELFAYIKVHEEKEDEIFEEVSEFSKEMEESLAEINAVHQIIKGHVKVLKEALVSDDKNYIRVALENDGRMFFTKLREHMHFEEKIFDSVLFMNNLKSEKKKTF